MVGTLTALSPVGSPMIRTDDLDAKKSMNCVFPYLSFDEVKSCVSNLIKFFSYLTLLYICALEMIEYLM